MKRRQMAPDWARLIEDLMRAGLSQAGIGKAMGLDLTNRMLSHYRAGVQPTFWRGEAILQLWVKTCGKAREEAPMIEVTHGHRVPTNRESPAGPQVAAALPQWPPPAGR